MPGKGGDGAFWPAEPFGRPIAGFEVTTGKVGGMVGNGPSKILHDFSTIC
jgi:hypothetical protein